MKLLIVTQTIDSNDPVLGFFVRWVEEFAKQCEEVTVICLKLGRSDSPKVKNVGKSDLPTNVRVFSLGKESTKSTAPSFARRCVARTLYTFRFLSLVWKLRHNYDTVFVHMNPEYIVLAGKLWRIMGKHISLWYTHKKVDMKLRIAVLFANVVFTASPESFRLKTKKLKIMGHGIDMELFALRPQSQGAPSARPATQARIPLHIITTGRISQTKRIMEMLVALELLSKRGQSFTFTLVGAPATDADIKYEKRVRDTVAKSSYANSVNFVGAMAHKDIPALLAKNNIFLNLSTTGSMDKAVLEAIATGMSVVTTNVAFRDLLSPAPGLFITEATPENIMNALAFAVTADISTITKQVRERYALPHL